MTNQLNLKTPSSWFVLGCIILLQSINGTRYTIFSYCSSSSSSSTTTRLQKQDCHFSYMELNNLMVFAEIGKLFGFLSGAAVNYVPTSIILIIGLIFGLVGYGVQYLYIVHRISHLSYLQILLLNALAGHSSCWISTYCYVLAIKNFDDSHGIVIAITSSYSAFSGKICTILVQCIEGEEVSQNSVTSLLFNWLAPTVVGFIVAIINFFLKFTHFEGNKNKEMSIIAFLLAITSGVYVVIESVIIQKFTHISPQIRAVVLLVVLMLPFLVAIGIGIHQFTIRKCKCIEETMGKSFSETTSGNVVVKERDIEKNLKEALMERNESGLKELFRNVNFWLFYLVNGFGAILAIGYMINLGRFSESFSNNETMFLLELSSTFGFFGRIFAVLFDWYTRRKSIISYPSTIVLIMLPMPMAILLLLHNSIRSFYISTGVIGTCSGALNAITPSTMYELFGDKRFVAKQTIFLTNIPLGLLFFGFLTYFNYQKEAKNLGICYGLQCYSRIFIIWGFISFLGTLFSFILHLRTHNLYLHRIS